MGPPKSFELKEEETPPNDIEAPPSPASIVMGVLLEAVSSSTRSTCSYLPQTIAMGSHILVRDFVYIYIQRVYL